VERVSIGRGDSRRQLNGRQIFVSTVPPCARGRGPERSTRHESCTEYKLGIGETSTTSRSICRSAEQSGVGSLFAFRGGVHRRGLFTGKGMQWVETRPRRVTSRVSHGTAATSMVSRRKCKHVAVHYGVPKWWNQSPHQTMHRQYEQRALRVRRVGWWTDRPKKASLACSELINVVA